MRQPPSRRPHRRNFLRAGVGAAALALGGTRLGRAGEPGAKLVSGVTREVLWNGREETGKTTWFHPRACMMPGAAGPAALMTLQAISGSDVFGPVHWSVSRDLGKTWSEPTPIPGLGRRAIGPREQEGVCDVSPDYHASTQTVLALGHNVYYRNGALARPQGPRHPVYVVRDAKGNWSKPRKLEWDDPRGAQIYTSNCGQRVMRDDGDVLIPLSFEDGPSKRSATTALCSFDGEELKIKQVGAPLRNDRGRGLLEPSVLEFHGRHYLTIRAEDGRGYVSVSDDGLAWKPQKAWAWDDGEPLAMSTTQQHWLAHSSGLFLVYTRKAKANVNVFRWRAPLYMAAVDLRSLRLVRESERIVLPMLGDGVKRPKQVARMGNFHVTNAAPGESWVTVGETLPSAAWRGNTLLARVAWSRPNALAR
jgi:hypothetical protein